MESGDFISYTTFGSDNVTKLYFVFILRCNIESISPKILNVCEIDTHFTIRNTVKCVHKYTLFCWEFSKNATNSHTKHTAQHTDKPVTYF